MLKIRDTFEYQPACIGVFLFISFTGLLSLCYYPPPFIFEVEEPSLFWSQFGPLFVFGMLTYAAFFRAYLTDPGGVPDSWSIEAADASEGPTLPSAIDKSRVCNKCNTYKPDRTHHCKRCDRCVLKMDHHCPWTSNCVGFYNYKFFFLLLFWGTVAMMWFVYMFASFAWNSFWHDEGDQKHWTLIATVTANCIVIGYLGNLLVQHIFLTMVNKTTIEWQGSRHSAILNSEYSLGYYNNIKEALGSNPLLWLLPVGTDAPGDGLRFRKHSSR